MGGIAGRSVTGAKPVVVYSVATGPSSTKIELFVREVRVGHVHISAVFYRETASIEKFNSHHIRRVLNGTNGISEMSVLLGYLRTTEGNGLIVNLFYK